jgi:hypothetical protein
VPDGIADDRLDLVVVVAERAQRLGHRAVDDLEISAAGQLLELDDGEIRFDAGGVAVHHQADGAGGRDNAGLGIAVAVALPELQRRVPGALGGGHQVHVRAGLRLQRHRRHRHALIAGFLAIGGAAMVADHPQHVVPVLLVTGKRAELARHLGRGRIGDARHDGAQRPAHRPAFVGVVGQPAGHEQPAEVGEAQA